MKNDYWVSLWVGQAESAEALESYLRTQYTEDGDIVLSPFAKDFGIRCFDEDLCEAEFQPVPSSRIRDLLKGHSYDDVLIPRIVDITGEHLPQPVNAVVLLYKFKYDGDARVHSTVENVRLHFVGAVPMDPTLKGGAT